jgi:hypothetical protein
LLNKVKEVVKNAGLVIVIRCGHVNVSIISSWVNAAPNIYEVGIWRIYPRVNPRKRNCLQVLMVLTGLYTAVY